MNLIERQKRELSMANEMGDRAREGRAYGKLGAAYHNLEDFEQAIKYNKQCLNIAREMGGQGRRKTCLLQSGEGL